MKKSKDLVGLALFSIENGKEIGQVTDLLINPQQGSVEFLIVDCGKKYLDLQILPFKDIIGVGEDAVTIENISVLVDFGALPQVDDLLKQNVQLIGAKILTKKGTVIGYISEFVIDDDNAGEIAGCELTSLSGSEIRGIIPKSQILTFGRDALIVQPQAEKDLPKEIVSSEETPDDSKEKITEEEAIKQGLNKEDAVQENISSEDIPKETNTNEQSEDTQNETTDDPKKLFENRQRQYLLGRIATKRIETSNGDLIVEEGVEITSEIFEKAKAADKLTELTMNTKAK